jgi:hypothetical protein
MVKVFEVPTAKVAVDAVVTTGAVPTTTVNVWIASGACPLDARIVSGYVPFLVDVPVMVAVPLPWFVKARPAGSL